MPVILLFENGRPIRALGGTLAKLTGYSDRTTIKEFIDQYFGDIMQEKQERKYTSKPKKKKTRIIKKTRVYTTPYGVRYPYYGYYPYYYRGYYRPSWGIGFGVGF
jgi:hypothetical protein